MSEIETRAQMKSIVEKLNKASEAYYSGSGEIMTDFEWNELFDTLADMEKQTGIILPDSPTHNVSHEQVVGAKEKHEFPALSLPKSKEVSDVVKWADGRCINISPKMDGLTLVVTYDDGKLSKIVTRGDGEIGSNITHLVDAIENIPKNIIYKKHLVIRGEAVISYADFENVNALCDVPYANPRNLASGSCNPASTVDQIKDRHLKWIPFTLVYIEPNIPSWSNRMLFLQDLGFETVEFETLSENIADAISRWSNRMKKFEYPVDGLVVVYEDTEYAATGSFTGHHNTKGGFAFKWTDEMAKTTLQNIEWSVSMKSINPIAVFEPVDLEGTVVKRASLCNVSECERLGIGGQGTELTVIKANKIIPKVVNAEAKGDFIIPDKCPVCHGQTQIKVSDTGVKVLVCQNSDCAAKQISKMIRFVSKFGFDINGLSRKRLEQLINFGIISSFEDIIQIPDNEDLAYLYDVDGWGVKSIENLKQAVIKARNIKSNKFLCALCIPDCGKDTSKLLMKKYSIYDIMNMADKDIAVMSDLVGDVRTGNILGWFKDGSNRKLVENLLSMCNVEDINDSQMSNANQKLSGMTFVITGNLFGYLSRDALKEVIEKNGGKVSGSVSAKTTYLINNDVTSTSSKNKKAMSLGIKIISEDEFNELL